MGEQVLVRAMVDAINLHRHVHAIRLNSGVTVVGTGKSKRVIRGCEAGTPDIMVMLPRGHVCWIEAKTAKGTLSKSQKAWHAHAEKIGHCVIVLRSVPEALAFVMGMAKLCEK